MFEDEPGGQSEQTVAPTVFEYEPTKQLSHVPPDSPLALPTGQGVHEEAPAAADDPAGHLTHVDESVEGACPAGQVNKVRTKRTRKEVILSTGLAGQGCMRAKKECGVA